MYTQGYYKNVNEEAMKNQIEKEGFTPIKFSDPSGHVYITHKHPEEKLLAFISGTMEVQVGKETYHCKAGDKLIIPGNIEHGAVAGFEGCTFFWSERSGTKQKG